MTTADGKQNLSDRIGKDIDRFCQIAYDDGFRSHLGASLIAHNCERFLWFTFRWIGREKFSGMQQRLFNRGHREEERFIEWLEGIGFKIEQINPATGKQWRISAVEGHFGGSCDGIATPPKRLGLPEDFRFLVEFKTHGTGAKFNELKQNGLIVAKPEHFGQTSVYGLKLGLQYVLYLSNNKNCDDIHCEVEQLDHSLGSGLVDKAQSIITSQTPPKRLSENPSYYECKWCHMNALCHHIALNGSQAQPERNCRSCQFAAPDANAEWFCSKWNAIIPKEYIPKACDAWTVLSY